MWPAIQRWHLLLAVWRYPFVKCWCEIWCNWRFCVLLLNPVKQNVLNVANISRRFSFRTAVGTPIYSMKVKWPIGRCRNSVSVLEKTRFYCVKKTSSSVLYSKTVTISADNDVVYISTRCGQNWFFGVKTGGTESCHFVPLAGPTAVAT